LKVTKIYKLSKTKLEFLTEIFRKSAQKQQQTVGIELFENFNNKLENRISKSQRTEAQILKKINYDFEESRRGILKKTFA